MYQTIANSNCVLRLADNATIPNDSGNKDWQEYQAWCALGNTAQPMQPITLEMINAPILAAINALEMKQNRALRERALGINTALAETMLADYDQQIAALRATLQEDA